MQWAFNEGRRAIFDLAAKREKQYTQDDLDRAGLEAAIRWQSENPIVPNETQAHEIFQAKKDWPFDTWEWVRWGACEWQRRMYLVHEPEEMTAEDLLRKLTSPAYDDAQKIIWLELYKQGKIAKTDIPVRPQSDRCPTCQAWPEEHNEWQKEHCAKISRRKKG